MNVPILSFLKALSLVSLVEHNLHFLDTKHNQSFPHVTLTDRSRWTEHRVAEVLQRSKKLYFCCDKFNLI